uniref:Uncharacterized protein n=1 Tax=Lygus hesperus TaxID=30085 RepID=A0A146KQR3_LYGHE
MLLAWSLGFCQHRCIGVDSKRRLTVLDTYSLILGCANACHRTWQTTKLKPIALFIPTIDVLHRDLNNKTQKLGTAVCQLQCFGMKNCVVYVASCVTMTRQCSSRRSRRRGADSLPHLYRFVKLQSLLGHRYRYMSIASTPVCSDLFTKLVHFFTYTKVYVRLHS